MSGTGGTRARRLFEELKRRRVFGVAAAYMVVTWLVWQIADVALPALGMPDWTVAFVIVLSALGFPIAIVLGWAYDLRPEGVVKTPDRDDPPGPAPDAGGPSSGPALEIREAASFEPGATIGQYRLRRRLGGGGMGVVYEALDERLGRRVALKFIAPAISADAAARERFLVEARAAAALDHPHVCTILEIGEGPGGRIFLAMPFYEGETLRSRIERGPIEPKRALEIARQIAEGLAAAHRRGIIHRDIKPANVIVTTDGVAKIVDFGVARFEDAAPTGNGAAVGTVGYMSPEQARGEEVDHRTDLWSLGVVLFEMLTGRRFLDGDREASIRRATHSSSPHSLGTDRPEVAETVRPILERALARSRERRYGSADELVADIDAVATARTAPERGDVAAAVLAPGERRICSIAVIRMSSHDRLLEELSPDEYRSLTRRIEEAVAEEVAAEDGVVLESGGSRHEAAFGVPVTREDDGFRALRAVRAVRERMLAVADETGCDGRVDLDARGGVDSGFVAVRKKEEREGYEVSGRPLRVARELARRAAEGEILVTSECVRLIAGAFETERVREVEVGGEDGVFTAHRIVGPGRDFGSLEARAEHGLTSFRGRERELEILSKAATEAAAGTGTLVQIVGEPGVGKSRLVHEWLGGLDPGSVRIAKARCAAVSRGMSYAPMGQALRQILEIRAEDGVGRHADEVVDGLLKLGEDARPSIPLILRLLSLSHPDHPFPRGLQGDQVRLAVAEAVAGLFSLVAARRPLVLAFEDWHWADEASTSALRQLAQVAPSFPLLIVVTLRPGYGAELPGLHDLTTLALDPLGEETSTAVLSSVLRADSVEERLARVLVARSGGNPFYIEEFGADLVEQGVVTVDGGVARLVERADVRLPDSVQAVIRARLDRVDPSARGVLLAASVIGREFSRSLLAEISGEPEGLDRALETLKAAGLVQQTRVLPDPAYRFKHALTQEVTYESLLSHQRRQLHLRAAGALEARDGSARVPHEVLAHHFAGAGAWLRAMPYAIDAARRSIELCEYDSALRMLDAAADEWASRLESSEASDRLLVQALFLKERVLDATGRRRTQQGLIDRLGPLVERSGRPADRTELDLRQGDLFASLRRYDDAEEVLERALRRSRDTGDPGMQRKALRSLGLVAWHQNAGREEEALRRLEEALELDILNQDLEAEIGDRQNICTVLIAMGEHARALEVAQGMADLVERYDIQAMAYLATHAMARCHRSLGNTQEALRLYEKAVGEERRGQHSATFALSAVANLHLELGEPERALETYAEAIEEARRLRLTDGLARALKAMGDVLEGLGREEEAISVFEEARPLFVSLEDEPGEATVTARLASLYRGNGRLHDAVAAWGTLRRLAERIGDRSMELDALEGLADATRSHAGEDDPAVPLYEEAARVALSLNDREGAVRVLNSLGVIAWNRGDWESARVHYQRALDSARAAGRPDDTALVLASLGAVHRKLGRPDEAVRVLEEALEETSKPGSNATLRGYALGVLGDALLDRADLDGAETAYSESLSVRRALGDEKGEGWMLLKLSEVEERRGAPDRAREVGGRAREIASRIGDPELLRASAAKAGS